MSIADKTAPFEAPRWRWLDWWLEPRWRALLTWVVIAAITGLLLKEPILPLLEHATRFLSSACSSHLGFALPVVVRDAAYISNFVVILAWFQPVTLRLNLRRVLVWFILAILVALPTFIFPSRSNAVFFGHFLGIPGLAIAGRRSRPWMSLLGAALATASVLCIYPYTHEFWWPAIPLSNLIYGAVMLYGTDPLPRQPAESQLDEDQG